MLRGAYWTPVWTSWYAINYLFIVFFLIDYAFIHLYVYICPYTFHDDVMFFHDALTRISQLFDKEGLHFLLFEA